MQRRAFIRDLALGAAALIVAPSARWLSPQRAPAVGPGGWSGASFAHFRGTSFRVNGPDGVQRLTLDDVSHKQSRGMETVSLRFRGDAQRQLAQGSYDFAHSELGRMSILVVPGAKSGGDRFYRAIFTRLG
jgi:hypothetical protein